jgi:hypothetical protein
MLAFHPLAGSASGIPLSVATTGADGTYRLTTYDVGDGAAEAEYAVTVVWPDDSLPRDECAEPTAHDRLGCRYADPAKSKLRATVVPGRNEVPLRASLGSSWSLPKMRDLERK